MKLNLINLMLKRLHTSFRWVKPAASLKPPSCSRACARRSVMFPLGKTGGLIEALTPVERRAARPRGFRWVKPAASLKQIAGKLAAPVGVPRVSAG